MPTLVKAAILGVLQGATEFLPVSSTAHLLIGGRLLGYDDPGGIFTTMIQLGSILAVMWLYRATIVDIVVGLPTRPESRGFAIALFAAFVPIVVAGALFASYIKGVLYGSLAVIAVAFVAGGIVMLLVERAMPTPVVVDAQRTPIGRAAAIGGFQLLSLVPGVSRSGATIIGGMAVGLDRAAAAEFSFFLAMPTMAAAFTHDLLDVRHQLTPDRALEIGVGLVAAFVASAVVVRPFLGFVRRAGFAPFAWYRIAAGLALLGALSAGWM